VPNSLYAEEKNFSAAALPTGVVYNAPRLSVKKLPVCREIGGKRKEQERNKNVYRQGGQGKAVPGNAVQS